MKKPESLRQLLYATALVGQTEKLATFIDRGRIECRRGANLSFRYHYTLSLVVQGYTGSPDALMIPILAWIAEQQPDLLDRAPHEPFTFESELLDADTADVSIELELSELVLVDRTGKSAFTATHVPEPVFADAFPGVCGVSVVQGLLDDGATIVPA